MSGAADYIDCLVYSVLDYWYNGTNYDPLLDGVGNITSAQLHNVLLDHGSTQLGTVLDRMDRFS